ncbi:MAG: single-stranded DNA-binding protein [Lachnospiraceae bacterium]|nr:single-stranded DNA-binding protein [Lachnospiraceae bacterium]
MNRITRTGVLKGNPAVMKNGGVSYATFQFYACRLNEDGAAVMLRPTETVYVAAFGGLADFAETSLRRGYTVTVTGQQKQGTGTGRDGGHQTNTNMVADEIDLVRRPQYASRVPQPLKESESDMHRERYEAAGGSSKPEPVTQSWEEGEETEDFDDE